MSETGDKGNNKPPDDGAGHKGSDEGRKLVDSSSGDGDLQNTGRRKSKVFVISDKAKEAARRKLKELQEAEKNKLACSSSSLLKDPASVDVTTISEPPTVSFPTASERNIVVSDDTLEATKAKFINDNLENIVESWDINDDFSTAGDTLVISGDALKSLNVQLIDETLLDFAESCCVMSDSSTGVEMKQDLVISEDAVKAGKPKLFQDHVKNFAEISNISSGFSTASGKRLVVSDEAVKAAKTKLTDETVDLPSTKTEPGFSTAGGRKIVVSEVALEAAKAKFNEENLKKSDETPIPVPVCSTEESIAETLASMKFELSDDDLVDATETDCIIPDFSTGGGIDVVILDDVAKPKVPPDNFENVKKASNVVTGFSTASGKKLFVSDKAVEAAKAKLTDDDPDLAKTDPGFSTAVRKIAVEDALKAAKAKLTDDDLNLAKTVSGFSTASGIKIAVSEDALEAAKAKLTEDDRELAKTVLGFSTAGGRKIAVSEDALEAAKAKHIVDDFDITDITPGILTIGSKNDVSNDSRKNEKTQLREESKDDAAEIRLEASMTKPGRVILESEEDIDNSMVFEEQNEIRVVMTERNLKLEESYCEADVSIEKESPDDVASEINESTRILLEDIDNSDDEWTSSEDPGLKTKAKCPLASVVPGGEIIPSLKVAVTRVYPIMYCALGTDGKSNFMTEKAFARHQQEKSQKQSALREELLPGLEAEIRNRFVKKEKINPKDVTPRALRRMTAEEILHILNNLEDDAQTVNFVMGHINLTVKKDLEIAKADLLEKIRRAIGDELEVKLKAALPAGKSPSRVLKIRVMDVESFKKKDSSIHGTITIWNPQEEAIANIGEGKVYEFQALKPGAYHDGQEVRLSTTKTTRISPVADVLLDEAFKRKLSTLDEVLKDGFLPPFGEFDAIGVIKEVEAFKEHNGQIVHLVDENGHVLKIKFWKSLDDSDLQDVIKVGNIVGCLNLQWRITSVENKMAFSQEFSVFHTTPKVEHLQNGFGRLNAAMQEIKQFLGTERQSSGGTKSISLPAEKVESAGVTTRNSAKRRYLDRFEEPSELPALPVASPSKRGRVSKGFVTPRRITPKK
ncbi:Breast cancer type 2 susceptibility protein [Orchesella cincta]|uniref:Breast cancer type 2 susceptibility protein n=1 Tax=Orchesella cincta TaxID=48709 RepID=A0A1D2NFP0_ORCCI|nr:Breast cancer type 2 susceptibility protein [Orchesella cincta]